MNVINVIALVFSLVESTGTVTRIKAYLIPDIAANHVFFLLVFGAQAVPKVGI